jgi:uncharacterized protein (DUF362 family)
MTSRREFLQAAALAGGALLTGSRAWAGTRTPAYFGVHEFIEAHPEAVFIFRTSVDAMTNAEGIRSAAHALGKTLFVAKADGTSGVPVSALVAVKPNLTCRGKWQAGGRLTYSIEKTRGTQTDVSFVEGIITSVKDLGVAGGQCYLREVNCAEDFEDGGYTAMAQRMGVELRAMGDAVSTLPPADVQWVDVPEGVWFSAIPYLWPVNAPGTFLLNVAKFKSHGMGMTLCAKNIQGSIALPYVRHCRALTESLEVNPAHVRSTAEAAITAGHARRCAANVPRWSTPGSGQSGGLWQETWATRCIDNNTVTHPALNIIEGVYGREGPFLQGPSTEGYGIDVLTNIVIFGKNAFLVDVIGTYLAGHEPGNFGLFHMAAERGLLPTINPASIPLYEWGTDGSAVLTPLSTFNRTPIRTLYLTQEGEPTWHLVDEPFDYSATGISAPQALPTEFQLLPNYPNPFNPSTSIPFRLPASGHVVLDIIDLEGRIVERIVNGVMMAGDHLAVWRADRAASGVYFGRLSFRGMQRISRMLLLR